MDDESRPNIFRQEVTLKDGFVKTVVAGSEEELAEGVAAVQNDTYPVSPDLTVPGDNAIVSPDNKPVEDAPAFIDNDVEAAAADEPAVKAKPAKKKTVK